MQFANFTQYQLFPPLQTIKRLKLVTLVSFIAMMSGCADRQYMVRFNSEPPAASLICNGKNYGYTPVNLYYDKSVRKRKYLDVSSCSANWVSGAKANYPSNLTIFRGGATTITLPRPDDIEGYTQDALFALEVKKTNYQYRQTVAAERQAAANEEQAKQLKKQNNKTTVCYQGDKVIVCK